MSTSDSIPVTGLPYTPMMGVDVTHELMLLHAAIQYALRDGIWTFNLGERILVYGRIRKLRERIAHLLRTYGINHEREYIVLKET